MLLHLELLVIIVLLVWLLILQYRPEFLVLDRPAASPQPPQSAWQRAQFFLEKEYHRQSPLICLLTIVLLALSIRLTNLDRLGPFIDESGHLLAATDYKLVSLLDRVRQGKVFGYVLFFPFAEWAGNPLLAARIFMACLGGLTTAGVFLTAERLGGRLAAIVAGVIWATIPYATFHDRMALHDPIVTCLVIWSLYLSLRAARSNLRWRALASGVLLGLAILTKVFAGIFVFWVFLIALSQPGITGVRRNWKLALWYLGGVALPCLPLSSYIATAVFSKNTYSDQFVSSGPTGDLLARNLSTFENWLHHFAGAPFEWFCVAAVIFSAFRPSRLKATLLLSILVTLGVTAGVMKQTYSRYLLQILLLLTILVAIVTAEWLTRLLEYFRPARQKQPVKSPPALKSTPSRWEVIPGSLLLGVPLSLSLIGWMGTNATMLASPTELKLAPDDVVQYLSGWTSGTGLPEAAAFLKATADRSPGKLLVFAQTWTTGGFALPLLLKADDRIEVRLVTLHNRDDLLAIAKEGARRPVYLFFEPSFTPLPEIIKQTVRPLPDRVFEYVPPRSLDQLEVYRWKANAVVSTEDWVDPQLPRAVSVTPSSGSGAAQTFAVKISDASGAGNVAGMAFLIGRDTSADGACYISYDAGANPGIALATDQGKWTGARQHPGSPVVLENSQCSVSLANSFVTAQGNELTLSVNVAFRPAFQGEHGLFVYTANRAQNTPGWRKLGSWTTP